jgi:hypothetical protein
MLNPAVRMEKRGSSWNYLELFGTICSTICSTACATCSTRKVVLLQRMTNSEAHFLQKSPFPPSFYPPAALKKFNV